MFDVLQLVRRFATWPSLALVVVGLAFGLLVRSWGGEVHAISASW